MAVCYNCFHKKSEPGRCPRCGYDPAVTEGQYPIALHPGSILNGRYLVGRVLGQGGFGITYIAYDDRTKRRVAIKEYLPTDFAGRSSASQMVRPFSESHRENFDYGKARFLDEAKTLAEFIGDEHIVRIHSYFEENGTAYFTMEYVVGLPLDKYMAASGGRISVKEADALLLPLMEAMELVHSKGIIHRDIAPDNIIITPERTAKLIDFGSARYSTGEKSKSLDVVIKHGFAPKEQYTRHGRQGPYTDVYSMAATYYYAITGKIPPDAINRMDKDELILPSALGVGITDEEEAALLKGLGVTSKSRFQSMEPFRAALYEAGKKVWNKPTPQPQPPVPVPQPPTPPTPQPQPQPKPKPLPLGGKETDPPNRTPGGDIAAGLKEQAEKALESVKAFCDAHREWVIAGAAVLAVISFIVLIAGIA